MTRILIAEHNEATAQYLKKTLAKDGAQITIVDNCLEAWRVSSSEAFDVLMVNIVMPGIDGFILAQRMLQENPETQIIFITGFAGVALDSYNAYSSPVTSRPFHLRQISARVRYMMGQGGLPMPTHYADGYPQSADNVIYADFEGKMASNKQQA